MNSIERSKAGRTSVASTYTQARVGVQERPRTRAYVRTTDTSFIVGGLGNRTADWEADVLEMFVNEQPIHRKLIPIVLPVPALRAGPASASAGLIQAYRSEYTTRYRRNPFFVKFDKYAKALDSCAIQLLTYGITPISWVSYSFALWADTHANRRNAPPMTWMFSQLRVRKNHAECLAKTTNAAVVCWPVSAVKLMRIHRDCWDDIWLSRRSDHRDTVRALVRKHWPARTFDTLYASALRDCTATTW